MAITPEAARIVNTTAIRYLKGATPEVMRSRVFLAMLEKKGRVKFNNNGDRLTWVVQFAQQALEAYGDMGGITFEPSDLYRQLVIDWRGYIMKDLVSDKESYMNSGDVALVERYASIMPTMMQSAKDGFGSELFVDGYATGNANRLHGLQSFTGAGTCAAGDLVAVPSDNYGGMNTNLQDQGGDWSTDLTTKPNSTIATDWPDGTGSPEYDYLAPKLVNWSSTAWGTSSTSWEDNGPRVLRRAKLWCTRTGGESGKPDLFLTNSRMYADFLNNEASKQRVMIPYKSATDLGFDGVINYDGVGFAEDFDVPANTGFLMNVDKMDLRCLPNEMFAPMGPTSDIKTLTTLFLLRFWGNCTYQPKHFAVCKNYA